MKKEEVTHILWEAKKKLRKIAYDKKGNYKKGLRQKQKAMLNIVKYNLFAMTIHPYDLCSVERASSREKEAKGE
jgi:hypothetical protein